MSELGQTKILNVNDNLATLLATGRALQRAGYQILEAKDGAEALALVQELPDLVILDVQLPDMSGFEVCRRIKSDPRTAHIPVLHLSAARVDASSKIAGLEGGADGYLTAPVEMSVLLAYMRALLRMHRAESEVILASRQWETSFSSLEEGVCVLDASGRVLRNNPAFEAVLGLSSGEAKGRPVLEVVLSSLGVMSEDAVTCLAHLERCTGVELQTAGRWVSLTLSVPGEPDIGFGAVLTLADITERKRMEQQTLETRKMAAIERLTAGMAHDFNNLLTSINGFAELLTVDLEENERLKFMAETILRSGERAAGLVRQLMAFSQKQHIAPQEVDLSQLIAEMHPSLKDLVGEDNELLTVLHEGPVIAIVDPQQMEQVIINLVAHARDSISPGGAVTVETQVVSVGEEEVGNWLEMAPGCYALVGVHDTGPGLSEDMKARIFEPFLYISDAVAAGTGLRLAAAYGIVKQSKGHIRVDSVPGEGTSFNVLLPSRVS